MNASSSQPTDRGVVSDTHVALPFAKLGHYQILAPLGGGGMGEVYRAYEPALDRHVAVKVIRSAYAADEQFVRRFQREATSAGKLSHPHVVTVHYVGHEHDIHFLAMQLVEGSSLADVLRKEGRLPEATALEIARQCLTGLAAAHRAGIVHRDIKPGNILLEEATGRVLIADFGLAHVHGGSHVTSANVVVGTPSFLAPEICLGKPASPQSDLYSVGVMLFQMLAGRVPFKAETASALLYLHVHESPPLDELPPETSPATVRLVANLLAKAPQDRYATAEEAAAEAERCLQNTSSPGTAPPAARPVSPLALALAFFAVVALTAVAVAAALSQRNRDALRTEPGRQTAEPVASPSPPPAPRSQKSWTDPQLVNSLEMKFVRIEGGRFTMGSELAPDVLMAKYNKEHFQIVSEFPPHEVTVTTPFYLSTCEVTQAQFEQVMGFNPSEFPEDGAPRENLPVDNVSWRGAEEFCQRLSELAAERQAGRSYRLPYEAEWEYAYRAGRTTTDGLPFAADAAARQGWLHDNSQLRTHAVATLAPNPWGLYDMAGNVAEWCQDRFARDYYEQSPQRDPQGPAVGLHRVVRGAHWGDTAFACRAAYRSSTHSAGSDWHIGFRVVCVPRAQFDQF